MNIFHSKPTIDKKDIQNLEAVLKTGQLAQGKKVEEFEQQFAKWQNIKEAVAANSGTSALHLSLLALDIGKGDEVIIPSHVCTALLNAVNYTGAKAKIADVNADDFNISVKAVQKNITKKTKAIIVPHMYGYPADLRGLLKLNIPIIEDCAQSMGAKYGNKNVGNFGVLSVFSFYATKVMTTGEGGMVISRNQRLINKIRDLRDYDNRSDYKIRFNYKMTDMAATLGISQLQKLPQMLAVRKKIAQQYDKVLKNLNVQIPDIAEGKEHIYFRYVMKAAKNHKAIMNALLKKGIHCAAPVFKPLHQYLKISNCPIAEQLTHELISIPIYPQLKAKEINHIIKSLKDVLS